MIKRTLIVLAVVLGVVFVPWLITLYIIFPIEELHYAPKDFDTFKYHFLMWIWGIGGMSISASLIIAVFYGGKAIINYIKHGG